MRLRVKHQILMSGSNVVMYRGTKNLFNGIFSTPVVMYRGTKNLFNGIVSTPVHSIEQKLKKCQ
jgi:hypothetical protein